MAALFLVQFWCIFFTTENIKKPTLNVLRIGFGQKIERRGRDSNLCL